MDTEVRTLIQLISTNCTVTRLCWKRHTKHKQTRPLNPLLPQCGSAGSLLASSPSSPSRHTSHRPSFPSQEPRRCRGCRAAAAAVSRAGSCGWRLALSPWTGGARGWRCGAPASHCGTWTLEEGGRTKPLCEVKFGFETTAGESSSSSLSPKSWATGSFFVIFRGSLLGVSCRFADLVAAVTKGEGGGWWWVVTGEFSSKPSFLGDGRLNFGGEPRRSSPKLQMFSSPLGGKMYQWVYCEFGFLSLKVWSLETLLDDFSISENSTFCITAVKYGGIDFPTQVGLGLIYFRRA